MTPRDGIWIPECVGKWKKTFRCRGLSLHEGFGQRGIWEFSRLVHPDLHLRISCGGGSCSIMRRITYIGWYKRLIFKIFDMLYATHERKHR